MTIFFSSSPYNLGAATCYVGCGTQYGENQQAYTLFKDRGAKITEPSGEILKSKLIPRLLIPWGHKELFSNGMRAVEVPLEYLPILFWRMKKEYYVNLNEVTDAGLKKMNQAIAYRINQLIVSGRILTDEDVVGRHERDIYEIENLHRQLRNFDRGRRSYLNFSSTPTEAALEKDAALRRAHSKDREEKVLQPWTASSVEDLQDETVKPEPVAVPDAEAPVFTDKPWLRG